MSTPQRVGNREQGAGNGERRMRTWKCGIRKRGLLRHSAFTIHHSAFTLAESLVSMLIIAGLLVVALNTVGDATVGRQNIGDRSRGQLLAQDLMVEILAQAYEEPVDVPFFGPEAPETSTSRADYDDVDDYDRWEASPPQKKDGTEIPDSTGWRRKVTVEYTDPDNLVAKMVSDTGVKRITVTVEHNDIVVASMVAIRTAAADTFAP